MNWRVTVVVLATMLSGSAASLATLWLEIPVRLYPLYFAGAPVAGCLLAFLAQEIWDFAQERKNQGKEPEELEKLVISVRYIDQEWHDAFELAGRLIEEGRDLFSQINQELYGVVGDIVSGTDWRYKGITEITAEGLRISDSVLCQLRTGHPDTSLGTTRQLFELMFFQKVIALDTSGATAERYQDFPEMRFLQDSINTALPNRRELGTRLGEIKSRYPRGTKFKPQFAWIKLQDGNSPNSMEDVVGYVVSRFFHNPADSKRARNLYLQQWVKLNHWTHITKPASRRKLGIRTEGSYDQIHLLEKSRVGLETPLSMAVMYLQNILITLEDTAHDLTKKSHEADLEQIEDTIQGICVALDSVAPEFLANDFRIRWQPIKDSVRGYETERSASASPNQHQVRAL